MDSEDLLNEDVGGEEDINDAVSRLASSIGYNEWVCPRVLTIVLKYQTLLQVIQPNLTRQISSAILGFKYRIAFSNLSSYS